MGCGLCKSAFRDLQDRQSPGSQATPFVPSSLFTVAEEISELEESKPVKGSESRVMTLISTVNRAGTESES
jgi:hypothetical protein